METGNLIEQAANYGVPSLLTVGVVVGLFILIRQVLTAILPSVKTVIEARAKHTTASANMLQSIADLAPRLIKTQEEIGKTAGHCADLCAENLRETRRVQNMLEPSGGPVKTRPDDDRFGSFG